MMIGQSGCISESESRMQENLYEAERKLKEAGSRLPVAQLKIVSSWPDGICCKTCAFWNLVSFGYGYCDAVSKNESFQLSDGGGLQTVPTFACSEWKPKSK